jgi:uncharacterized membrane protein YraQ (UPF0718 family)
MEQIIKISEFILKSCIHIWPYLLVTIPLAVVINLSGASKYISRAFGKNPLLSVLLATIVGAFSPFCSCGVIPVISSLLIGGVPLAPVMSFWIASPSMDPEIFFLSSSVIGWKLAVWRLASTFVISLLAGYITHLANKNGFINSNVLRTQSQRESQITLKSIIISIGSVFIKRQAGAQLVAVNTATLNKICCTVSLYSVEEICECPAQTQVNPCNSQDSDKNEPIAQWKRVSKEIIKATFMVTKFMGIAFFITALITFYLPEDTISSIVSGNPTTQVILATIIGIPMYTSNITALPIVGGLIGLGLNKGAALSFLIAGATTTLPAMVAVWGITKRRVFLLYLLFALFGALLAGLCFNLFI